MRLWLRRRPVALERDLYGRVPGANRLAYLAPATRKARCDNDLRLGDDAA